MLVKSYNWKRFWCPRTGKINLSDNGFMADPDSTWGHAFNPDIVSFESIANVPCLVMLGEPGMGKTFAMQAGYEVAESADDDIFLLDLRSFGSEERLMRNLFENPTFTRWLEGNYRLNLFLDSLDECLMRIDTVATLLADELKKYPIERLNLRIACRTADWPNVLERGLIDSWSNEAVQVYELAPLRQVDVRVASEANGLNPDAFIDEITNKEVVPLAIKPVTLQFLLNLYQQHGSLPKTQSELYFSGCRGLCEELNESRIASPRLQGDFTADQRMAVAARIAAITIFANRDAIWTGSDFSDIPQEDVTSRDLCGKKESVGEEDFEVTRDAIKDVLATGLFSSRGPDRLGWAHKTYAEFLAARYLIENKIAVDLIMSLVIHPDDPNGKLVPQLHETAAWLGGMNSEIFKQLMINNPEVLLCSDVSTAQPADRASLAESLLKLFEKEQLLDLDLDLYQRYRKLSHPTLPEQLRPYICDNTKSTVVRRVAIDIAEACELRSLQDDLANIALDLTENLQVRVQAACAVCRIGDDETKKKLKPLAIGQAGEDPDDELKGFGLMAVWPESMTASELFSNLTPPKKSSFVGPYQVFISQKIAPYLKPSDLTTALNWVRGQRHKHHLTYPKDNLIDSIMLLAWENLQEPAIAEAFAEAALSSLRKHDAIIENEEQSKNFCDSLAFDDERRRTVLKLMVHLLEDPREGAVTLAYGRPALLYSKDVIWMIEQLSASQTQVTQSVWAELICIIFDRNDQSQLSAIYAASQVNEALAKAFEWLFSPVELGSPRADQMKAQYLDRQKWERGEQKKTFLTPSPAERIAILLGKFESGDLNAWWNLNLEMTLEPDSTHYGSDLESDLTVMPGWKAADEGTKARIIEAAKKYILDQDPETQRWLGTNTFYRPAFAGYRALQLLLQKDPLFISSLSNSVWAKWAPMILAYPTTSGFGGEEPHYDLVKMAYLHAPDQIISTLMVLIDQENEEGKYIFITRKLKYCWDSRLITSLLSKVSDKRLKPVCMGCLLCDLLEQKSGEARTFAESLVLTLSSCKDDNERSRAVVAAGMLMLHTEDAGWNVIWPSIHNNFDFAGEVIVQVADRFDERATSVGVKLSEEHLADLYIWMVRHYPYKDDPQDEEVHWVGPRENVAEFRDSLLGNLKRRGTYKSCEAICRIVDQLPEVNWLKWSLLEAQSLTRYRTWIPLKPHGILRIAKSRDIIVLHSGDQLLSILSQSLLVLECEETCKQGTAFLLAGIGVVTCQHVLGTNTVAFRPDKPGNKYKVSILKENKTIDLAIIEIDVPCSSELEMGSADNLRLMDPVFVAGFPNFKIGDTGVIMPGHVAGFRPVSGIRRILTNALIIAGNSGGPVFDAEHRVIGIAVTGADRMEEAIETENYGIIPVDSIYLL